MCVINIEAFLPMEEFRRQVVAFPEYVKSCPTAPGFDGISVPGEFESRERRKRLEDGIFLSEETWNRILETARDASVK